MTTAARILGVDPSTVSRRQDLQTEARGGRDRVLSAFEVLRLAAIFRKRSLNDVAYDVLEHARGHAPDEVDSVEREIEVFFEQRDSEPELSRDEFLAVAARLLPPGLHRQIADCLANDCAEAPSVIVGYPPRK